MKNKAKYSVIACYVGDLDFCRADAPIKQLNSKATLR